MVRCTNQVTGSSQSVPPMVRYPRVVSALSAWVWSGIVGENQCDVRQKVCSHLRGGLPHMAAHRYGTVS